MKAPFHQYRLARHLRTATGVFIGIYALLIPAVIATGGFEINLLGLHFNDLSNPVSVLLVLLGLWLILTLPAPELALVTASLLMGLATLETGLRIWNPPLAGKGLIQLHRASPIFGWELIPGAGGIGVLGHPIRINADGCRDAPHAGKTPKTGPRIVAVGDSFTFGVSVALEDTYLKQLGRRIRREGNGGAETVSTGVPGYGMWQYLEVLRRKALSYHPDILILQFYLDDLAAGRRPYDTPGQWQGFNPFGLTRMRSASHLYNFVHNANMWLETKYRHRRGHEYLAGIAQRRDAIGPAHPDKPYHRMAYGAADPDLYTAFAATLAAFVTEVRSAGIPLVAVYIPDAGQLGVPAAQAANRYLARLLAELHVPFVDATARFEQEPDPRPLYLFPMDAHISPRGHFLVADCLYPAIAAALPARR